MYMNTVFEYSCPCMKYELTKQNIKEFHIKYNLNKEFLENYYETNKKTFLETIYTYIHLNHSNTIKHQGIDFHYDDDNIRKPHIYIHVDLNDRANEFAKTLINDLHNEYNTNWIQFRIPKLMTTIKNQMNSNGMFSEALNAHRNSHSSIDTETLLHVLSNQILWYYDDISFLTNRHKYDFQ